MGLGGLLVAFLGVAGIAFVVWQLVRIEQRREQDADEKHDERG